LETVSSLTMQALASRSRTSAALATDNQSFEKDES
jgi:hypothetical protein